MYVHSAARAFSAAMTPESLEDFEPRERWERVSRAVNLLLAVVLLVVISPVMLFAAIAVILTSRGPVLYTQTRVGIDRQ